MEYANWTVPSGYWYFNNFDNGQPIPKPVRELYRWRRDLQQAFPNPFQTAGDSFYAWLVSEEPGLLAS